MTDSGRISCRKKAWPVAIGFALMLLAGCGTAEPNPTLPLPTATLQLPPEPPSATLPPPTAIAYDTLNSL